MSDFENKSVLRDFTQMQLQLRAWEFAFLPFDKGMIAIELFWRIADSHASGEALNFKKLFYSSRFSARGLRYMIEEFEAEGWCVLCRSSSDKRFREIVPTQHFLDRLGEYVELASKLQHRPRNSSATNDLKVMR